MKEACQMKKGKIIELGINVFPFCFPLLMEHVT
jgi:hypothetical protein